MDPEDGFYGDDLAFVHDVGFTGFVQRAMPALEELLRATRIECGVVVDLGCGSGRWLARLVELGYQAIGVDVSPAFLALAQERAPEARLIQASLFEVDLPRAGCVTAVGECLNYAGSDPDAAGSPAELFERVHSALEPGGIFVFDVALPGRVGPRGNQKFVLDDSWALLLDAREDEDGGALERRITTFRQVGDTYRRQSELHRLRLWPASRLGSWLAEAGFEVRQLDSYGELPFPTGYAAFCARKPGP